MSVIWVTDLLLGIVPTAMIRAKERNSKTVLMGVDISAGDLLTKRKLKNTDKASHLHINQRNIPSTAHPSLA